jgi:hypothetical protein
MVSDRWNYTSFMKCSSNKYIITQALSEMPTLLFVQTQVIAKDLAAYKRRQTPYFVWILVVCFVMPRALVRWFTIFL